MSELSKNLGVTESKIYRGEEYLIYDGYRNKSVAEDTARWLTMKNGADLGNGAVKQGNQFKARVYKTGDKKYPFVVYYCPMGGWNKSKKR